MYSLEEIKQFYYEEMEKREITTIDAIYNKHVFDEIQKLEKRDVHEIHNIIHHIDIFMKDFLNETTDEILQWICEKPNDQLTKQVFDLQNERLAKKYFAQI